MLNSKWFRIGFTLMFGLFVAYLDRSNLSVGLPAMAKEVGFEGAAASSLALTGFLIGYAVSNFFGGFITYKLNPKNTIITMSILWSLVTLLTAWVTSLTELVVYRIILGIAEGIYWPQQFRFARAWFSKSELTKGTNIIQFYGQYMALALGFVVLTPIYQGLGWKFLFFITGGLGLVIVLPMYLLFLKSQPDVPLMDSIDDAAESSTNQKISFQSLGGASFLLIVFSYFANGMLFWGITLWIPMVVSSLGFSGMWQGFASSLPYMLSIAFAIPMSFISDRTQKRTTIASLGLIVAGVLLVFLPLIQSPAVKLGFITFAVAFFTSSYTTNIWSIITSSVDKNAVGPAAGIVNGIGAGGGGTVAGFLVGMLYKSTGSYLPGFAVIGVVAIVGGLAVSLYGKKIKSRNANSLKV